MILPPCRDCQEAGCGVKHDTCERFLKYKKQVDEYNAKKKHASTMNYLAKPPKWRKRQEGKWK